MKRLSILALFVACCVAQDHAGLVAFDRWIVAWSASGVKVFGPGSEVPVECGLDGVRDVISISPWPKGLAILTKADTELWENHDGRFERLEVYIPEGAYNKAVWFDYDHDGNLDLLLLGDKSALLRSDGRGGFSNVLNNFPFIAGRAVDGVTTKDGRGLIVLYSDRPGVLYEDKGGGRWEAHELNNER